MTDVHDRLAELRELGLYRRMRMISGPQGPRVVLDGKPVLLLCSNNYLGLADHPRVREAAADAAMRWGVGAGRVAARVGDDDRAPAPRGAPRRLRGQRGRAAVRLGLPGERRRRQRAGGRGVGRPLRRAQPRLDRRRLPARARRDVRLPPLRRRAPRVGAAQRRGPQRADRHRLGVLDGRRRRAARARSSSSRGATACASWSTRRTAPAASGRAGAARCTRPASRTRSTSSIGTLGKALGAYGAYAACDHAMAQLLLNTARPFIYSTAPPPPVAAGALAALELLDREPQRVERLRANADDAARRAAPRGLRRLRLDDPDRPDRRRRRGAGDAHVRARDRGRRVRPGDPAADGARGHVAAAPGGHGVALARRAARGGAGARPRGAARRLPPRRRRAGGRRARGRRRARSTPRPTSRAPRRGPCAAASSPAPTPASARRCSPPRSSPPCAPRGVRVAAFKPVVTGLDEPEPGPPGRPRAARRRRRRSRRRRSRRRRSARRCRRTSRPSSPGRRSTRPRPIAAARAAGASADALVVEGVGGLLVPLTTRFTVRDLAVALGLPVVVAARPGLGTISHTLLTVEAARAAGLDVRAVVLTPWPDEPSAMERSNRETIARDGGGRGRDARARSAPASTSSRGRRGAPVDAWLGEAGAAPAGVAPDPARAGLTCAASASSCAPRRGRHPALAAIMATPEVARWWTDETEETHARARPRGRGRHDHRGRCGSSEEIIGLVAGAGRRQSPMYRHAGIDLALHPDWHGRGLGADTVRTIARYLIEERGHHRHHDRPGGRERRRDPQLRARRLPRPSGSCATTSAARRDVARRPAHGPARRRAALTECANGPAAAGRMSRRRMRQGPMTLRAAPLVLMDRDESEAHRAQLTATTTPITGRPPKPRAFVMPVVRPAPPRPAATGRSRTW